MSEDGIVLIPCEPTYVPDLARPIRAQERFVELAPDADDINIKVGDRIRFFDCGGNFERVLCPSCNAEIPIAWWQLRMDEDYEDNSFKLAQYLTPCCNAVHTLQQLRYQWSQGFARFAIEVMNPNIGELSDRHQTEFETIVGTRLHIVYQHV